MRKKSFQVPPIAGVTELAYVLALEARFCGFDSRLRHHFHWKRTFRFKGSLPMET